MQQQGSSEFYSISQTMADDTAKRVEENPKIVLSSCNIHILDNDAYYGNAFNVSAPAFVNDVIFFEAPIRPYDLMFKNYNAGSNTTIVIVGTIKEK